MLQSRYNPPVPQEEGWIALRRQSIFLVQALVREGKLRQTDVVVLLALALNQDMRTGVVKITIAELCRQLRVGSSTPTAHSLRRLRSAGFVARVGGFAGSGFYVLSPEVATCGGPRERANHAKIFRAALRQAVPVKPATASAIRARHAMSSQLAQPAAA